MMDAAGIERICLTTWARPGVHLTSNDRIREFVAAYPDRIVGVATVRFGCPSETGPDAAVLFASRAYS